jgi:prepilin-type N-terminal cleavage/methylation domain-containing protein
MRQTRRGFSLIELVIVCVLVGGLTMISIPRVNAMREGSNIRAAKQQIAAAIATTRAAAVQKGRPARFRVSGNVISVLVDTSATDSIFVVRKTDLGRQFSVTVELGTPAQDSLVRFEARGFAVRTGRTDVGRYVIRGPTRADTVCIGIIGQLMTRGCAL